MDYILFLTGLFLLATAAACFFCFREDHQLSRWPLLALALTILAFKVWFGILVFAFDLHASATFIHALLGSGFVVSLIGFCLSPLGHFREPSYYLKSGTLIALFLLTFGIGIGHQTALSFIAPMLVLSFVGGWKTACFYRPLFPSSKPIHPLVSAVLLTGIAALCLHTDAANTCYDISGFGDSTARSVQLGAFATAAACSIAFCAILWAAIYQKTRIPLPRHLMARRRAVTSLILTATVFTCANGAWLAHWLGAQSQEKQTATLLSALHLGADNLDPSQILKIQGKPDETSSPAYMALRTKLLQVREALPGVHFTYLLGMRNQKLVFLVDAEDPTHKDIFSPPGEPVKDYPAKWLPELAGNSSFCGPDRDEWGVWFSACVPVFDQDEHVVALLGIDYPAAMWLQPLAIRHLAAMVVTFSVALLLIALASFHITAKEAEHNLLRSRAEANRLALVAKRTDNAVVITDPSGRIEWVNEGFSRISGYTREEAVGQRPGSFLQRPHDNPNERIRMRECVQAGLGFETEIINYTKSGHAYIIHIECQPLVDRNGSLTGFMAIERDVTQIRRTTDLLEAIASISTTLLSAHLEPDVWGKILAKLGTAANADRCYIFRIHPHPVLATPAMSQSAEWNSGAATPQLQNPELQNFSFQENGYGRWLPELLAGRVICGATTDFPVEEQAMLIAQEIRSLVVVPIFTGDQLTGFMGFDACRENRVWQNWEIAILRSAAANIGLRQVVQNEADALVLARDEAFKCAVIAENASRAKTTFLATMSHEIRTPLNAVIGMASLLETTSLNAQQRDFTETILISGNFLLELITDILDYSRIEAGNIELNSAPISLADLCREAFDVVRLSAVDKPLELISQLAAHLPAQAVGDPTRLRQILVNLLSNAVKFTPSGFVSLMVDGYQAPDDLWHLTFEIKDSGVGMSADALAQLFQPFIQADSSPTRRFGGSGLGLAISKRLALAMGGDITVQSVRDHGSTFLLSLTLKPAPHLVSEAPVLSRVPTSSQLNILIVDDNEINRRILEEMLASWGLSCHSAANGSQAVQLWMQFGPCDWVITDQHMPDMDGIEMTRHLRSLPGAAQTRFSLLSSETHQPDEIRALFHDVGSKPIWPSSIHQILTRLCPTIDPTPSRPSHTTDEFAAQRLADLKVLVAEDNPNNQKVIQLLLLRLGIEADLVADGQQALEAVSSHVYDIIFLDLQMPVMDGLETSRKIRALNLAKRPFLAALTANAFQQDRDAARAAGMDDYLAKPVTLDRLRSLLFSIVLAPTMPTSRATVPQSSTAEDSNRPPELLNDSIISNLAFIGHDGYQEIIDDAINATSLYLDAIDSAIQLDNQQELREYLHKFRGMLLQIGCHAMPVRLQQLENKSLTPAQAPALREELKNLWQQSLRAIREWEKSIPEFNS